MKIKPSDFHGKRFAQALALQMETQAMEVKVCIHSFLFYKNVVFRPRLNILIFLPILG